LLNYEVLRAQNEIFFFSCSFEECVHQILTLEKWETFHLSGIYYHANMFFENKEKKSKNSSQLPTT
jgi:hypothetical protein